MGYGVQGCIISGLELRCTTKCITFVIHFVDYGVYYINY